MTDPNHAHEVRRIKNGRPPDGTLTFQVPDGSVARVTWIEAAHMAVAMMTTALVCAEQIGVLRERIEAVLDDAAAAADRDVFRAGPS